MTIVARKVQNEYSTSSGWLSEVGSPSRFAIWLYFCWSSRTRFSALANSMATAGLYPRAKSPLFVSTNWASFSSINLNVLRRSNSTTRCCSCCTPQRKESGKRETEPERRSSEQTNINIAYAVYGRQRRATRCLPGTRSLIFHTSYVIQQTNQCSSSQWTLPPQRKARIVMLLSCLPKLFRWLRRRVGFHRACTTPPKLFF